MKLVMLDNPRRERPVTRFYSIVSVHFISFLITGFPVIFPQFDRSVGSQ